MNEHATSGLPFRGVFEVHSAVKNQRCTASNRQSVSTTVVSKARQGKVNLFLLVFGEDDLCAVVAVLHQTLAYIHLSYSADVHINDASSWFDPVALDEFANANRCNQNIGGADNVRQVLGSGVAACDRCVPVQRHHSYWQPYNVTAA